MRAIAVPMILLMLSASLAGCTGGDPDGNDESSIDMDILNQMIDDNLQDFINNTSVTVNQEIHYHNNTTVNNHYHNNTTVNEGSAVTENNFQTDYTNYTLGQYGNASGGTDEIMFVMHMEFTAEELAPDLVPRPDIDPRDLVYSYTKNFTGYVWVEPSGNNSSGYYQQTNIQITHQVPCSIFYTFEDHQSNTGGIYYSNFWEDQGGYYNYFEDFYGDNSSDSTSNMTGFDYYYAGYQSESFCNPTWSPWVAQDLVINVGNITIPEGYMISVGVTEYYHLWGNVSSPDGNETDPDGGSMSGLWYDDIHFVKESGMVTYSAVNNYGGWEDLTLEIDLNIETFWETTEITITLLYNFTPVVPVE